MQVFEGEADSIWVILLSLEDGESEETKVENSCPRDNGVRCGQRVVGIELVKGKLGLRGFSFQADLEARVIGARASLREEVWIVSKNRFVG